jgi:hypothetical protein
MSIVGQSEVITQQPLLRLSQDALDHATSAIVPR